MVWVGACWVTAAAQQAQNPAPPAQGRGGLAGLFPETEPDDAAGFVPIFDGKTLNGWDGDLTFWRAENGSIVGETTPEKVVKVNNFLIWRGGTVRDFELKVELLADALAGPQAQTLAAIERLLQDRPASLAAFRRWRHAVGEATRISVVSVRLAGDDLPRLNVYQSIAVPARLSP